MTDNTFADLGKDGAITLAKALEENNRYLNLDCHRIGDKGVVALAEILKTNTSITSLSLKNNDINDKGAIALTEMLKINTSIIHLNLDGNNIGSKYYFS